MFDVISSTELEKTKKDLAALKEQAAGLTREYDRLLEEHSKAQVGIREEFILLPVLFKRFLSRGTSSIPHPIKGYAG